VNSIKNLTKPHLIDIVSAFQDISRVPSLIVVNFFIWLTAIKQPHILVGLFRLLPFWPAHF